MAKQNKSYTLTNSGGLAVTVKQCVGKASYYPYNDIYDIIEVDVHFDTEIMKIKTFRDEEDWTYRLLRFEGDSLANWQCRESACRYVGEEAITAAEAQVRKNIRNVIRLVKAGRKNTTWLTVLKPVADKVIKHWSSDFYFHDALEFAKHSPTKFLWLVRSTGTELIIFKDRHGKGVLDYQRQNPENTIYCYSNGNFEECSIDYAGYFYERYLPTFEEAMEAKKFKE